MEMMLSDVTAACRNT